MSNPQGGYANVRNTRFYYEMSGQGQPADMNSHQTYSKHMPKHLLLHVRIMLLTRPLTLAYECGLLVGYIRFLK